ncbi:hypothetical protein AB4037_09775 [Labrys sp. KB_33_2]
MSEEKTFETEIAPFRQPMVTSIGIALGFLLALVGLAIALVI